MEFSQISSWELEEYLNCNDCLIIDLRDEKSYNEGHVPGAINIPYEDLERGIMGIDNKKELIMYCERGGRSFAAAKEFGHIYNIKIVTGGIHSYRGKIELHSIE